MKGTLLGKGMPAGLEPPVVPAAPVHSQLTLVAKRDCHMRILQDRCVACNWRAIKKKLAVISLLLLERRCQQLKDI